MAKNAMTRHLTNPRNHNHASRRAPHLTMTSSINNLIPKIFYHTVKPYFQNLDNESFSTVFKLFITISVVRFF